MTNLEHLKANALQACILQGHKMGEFKEEIGLYVSQCKICGDIVTVNPTPFEYIRHITGEAATSDCEKKP